MASPEEDAIVSEMKDDDEEEDEEDMEASSAEEGEDSLQKAKQAITCRSVTLNTLMEDGIIQPGEGVLSIDYLGQRFEADLLESGKIKWQGSQEEFGTPSAWALHCKRLVNPIKRSGCGWASVKYKNRKLDIWKSTWARKHRTANTFKSPHQNVSTSAVTSTTAATAATTSTSSPSASNSTTITTTSTLASTTTCSTTSVPTTTTTSTVADSAVTESQPALSSPPPPPTTSSSSSSSQETASCSEKPSCPPHEKTTRTKDMEVETEPVEDLPLKQTPIVTPVTSTPDVSALKTQLKAKVTSGTPQDDVTTPLNLTTATSPVIPVHPPGGVRKKDKLVSNSGVHSPRQTLGSRYDDGSFVTRERKAVPYSSLGNRTLDVDPLTLVKCEQFDTHSKIQPFTVSVTSNSLLLMDFHCHLTKSEVVGYLGGRWDSHKQHLSIEQVFPACCRLGDKERAPLVEEEIRRSMRHKNLMIVGWYHSHPYCPPDPSLRDVDCQMAYQLKMRGTGCMYLPCVGFVIAPFEKLPPKPDSKIQAFWVMPNLEHQNSFNIPMHVSYSILRDSSLTEDLLSDMKNLTEFYRGAVDRVQLRDHWGEAITYMDKIKASLRSKLPEDQLDSGTFLDYVQQLLRDLR